MAATQGYEGLVDGREASRGWSSDRTSDNTPRRDASGPGVSYFEFAPSRNLPRHAALPPDDQPVTEAAA